MIDNAEEWLYSNYPTHLPSYTKYRLKDANSFPAYLFDESYIKEISARNWWEMVEMRNQNAQNLNMGFIILIKNIQSCPASSGSIERFFSTYGIIWSKLRNKLGKDKSEKLVRTYRYLRS